MNPTPIPLAGKLNTGNDLNRIINLVELLIGLEGVVICDREHIDLSLLREVEKFWGTQRAIRGCSVAVKVYIHGLNVKLVSLL